MPENKRRKIIFALLWFEGAVISFNTACIAAVIPAISRDLHKDSFEIARVISFYMIPYGAAALIYAPLVKRYSIKVIKIFCLCVFTLASLIGGLSTSVNMLFSSRILAGIAASATTPVALILIGELASRETRGRMIGAFFSATFLASFAGVFLSGVLPWRQLFILPAVLGAVNLILVAFLFDFKPKVSYDYEISYLKVLRDARIARIFMYIFILSMAYHGIYNWLGVYFSQLSFSQIQISLLLSIVGFSGIFGQPFGGWVTDKKGRIFAATLGLGGLSLATLLLIKPFSFYYLASLLLIFGISWTMNHNAVSTALTDFPDALRPELASLNSAVRFSSGGLGVSLAGIFMQRSFGFSFLGLGIIILALAIASNRILKAA
ncbi:MFS transporter [bacterium]|nr:MAG: MFS transporter [bacterium]